MRATRSGGRRGIAHSLARVRRRRRAPPRRTPRQGPTPTHAMRAAVGRVPDGVVGAGTVRALPPVAGLVRVAHAVARARVALLPCLLGSARRAPRRSAVSARAVGNGTSGAARARRRRRCAPRARGTRRSGRRCAAPFSQLSAACCAGAALRSVTEPRKRPVVRQLRGGGALPELGCRGAADALRSGGAHARRSADSLGLGPLPFACTTRMTMRSASRVHTDTARVTHESARASQRLL